MRRFLLGTLALCLLSACGPEDAPEAVPINGNGGSGGGGSSAGSGGSVGGVAILSHNAGQDCMSCHKAGGTGASKGIFTVAGTVYKDGGTPQTLATVLMYPQGSTTAQATMTTDGLGNFFTTQPVASLVPAAGQQFAQGAHAVVRPNSGSSRSMLGVITNGSCNACHSPGGGVARVTAQQVDSPFGVSIASSDGAGELPSPVSASHAQLAQIAAGAAHSCVVKSDGGVRCWGSNDQGQLGNTSVGTQATPIAVAALGQVSASTADLAITAGDAHTCVIAAPGNLVLCWGANANGQLGNGGTDVTAVSIISLAGVSALNASGDDTCARTDIGDTTAWHCWGANFGAAPKTVDANVDASAVNLPVLAPLLVARASLLVATSPQAVPGLESLRFRHIATGPSYSCGITTDDQVKCWEGSHASVDVPLL